MNPWIQYGIQKNWLQRDAYGRLFALKDKPNYNSHQIHTHMRQYEWQPVSEYEALLVVRKKYSQAQIPNASSFPKCDNKRCVDAYGNTVSVFKYGENTVETVPMNPRPPMAHDGLNPHPDFRDGGGYTAEQQYVCDVLGCRYVDGIPVSQQPVTQPVAQYGYEYICDVRGCNYQPRQAPINNFWQYGLSGVQKEAGLEEGVVEACFMEGLAGLAGRSKRRPARQSTKIKASAAKPSSFAQEDRQWNQDSQPSQSAVEAAM